MFIVDLVRILSVLLAIVGTTFLIPIGVALYCGETNVLFPFLVPMLISWIFCLIITLLFKKRKITLNIRKTYVVVACCWIFTSLFGMVPMLASGAIPDVTNAFFESVSGFSTTGGTILEKVEEFNTKIMDDALS